jgi:hypothetical protein
MNDRELLELAAKACDYGSLCFWSDELGFMWDAEGFTWNPLNDDGDALRLAVKLGMDLLFTAEDVECIATQHEQQIDQEMVSPWACESWTLKNQDTYAATRRAIVRAAAEIGRRND